MEPVNPFCGNEFSGHIISKVNFDGIQLISDV